MLTCEETNKTSKTEQDLTMKFDAEAVVKTYEKNFSIYENFKIILERYIRNLIEIAIKEGMLDKEACEIKSRTKTIESFKGKINRDDKRLKYTDPLNEVTDLVGIKIMLTSLKDENLVCELLKKELKDVIDKENSVDKVAQMQKERKFGYLGRHLVISFDDRMFDLSDNNKFKKDDFRGLKAEIQIKTLLQHVWAEIEHKARYKAGEELSVDKKRYFDRLAALIEVADDLFKDLIEESEKLSKKAKKVIDKEQESDIEESKENKKEYKEKKHKSVELDSRVICDYLNHEKVKEKFKNLETNKLRINYKEEVNFVSAKLVELLKLVKIDYTIHLSKLFDDEKLKKILNIYAEKMNGKVIFQKLSILQILSYAKANLEQRKEIKKRKLIFEKTIEELDRLISEIV